MRNSKGSSRSILQCYPSIRFHRQLERIELHANSNSSICCCRRVIMHLLPLTEFGGPDLAEVRYLCVHRVKLHNISSKRYDHVVFSYTRGHEKVVFECTESLQKCIRIHIKTTTKIVFGLVSDETRVSREHHKRIGIHHLPIGIPNTSIFNSLTNIRPRRDLDQIENDLKGSLGRSVDLIRFENWRNRIVEEFDSLRN